MKPAAIIPIAMILGILTGCAASTPPTPTVSPTDTATPVPPTATATPLPTATLTPTLDPAQAILDNALPEIVIDQTAIDLSPHISTYEWNPAFERDGMSAEDVWRRAVLLGFAWRAGIEQPESLSNEQLANAIAGAMDSKLSGVDPTKGLQIIIMGWPVTLDEQKRYVVSQRRRIGSAAVFEFGIRQEITENGQWVIRSLFNSDPPAEPRHQSQGVLQTSALGIAYFGEATLPETFFVQPDIQQIDGNTESSRRIEERENQIGELLWFTDQSLANWMYSYPLTIYSEQFSPRP